MPSLIAALRGFRPWSRHSLVLVVAGTVYLLVGLGYALTAPNPTRDATLVAALHWAPLPAWGCAFIVVGCLAILSSRWPPASETWGYTSLTGLSVLWSGFYVLGLLRGAPGSGLTGAVVWALMGFIWWAVSGLVNPTPAKSRGR